MSPIHIDPILLGHNPFFGIDHLSQETGNFKAAQFEDTHRIIEVLLHCHDLGVRGMMMSTHPRASAISEQLGKENTLSKHWRLYPLVPYIQKYVRGANEKGLINVVKDTLMQTSLSQKFSMLWRGGQGLVTKDIKHALTLLIDIELVPFKGRQLGAVFLHDALTDLALGLGVEAVLDVFREHVNKKYGVPAGFVTKNLPLLRARLAAQGWNDMLAMASFNALGFQVNPSLDACIEAIRQPDMTFVAMSTLAAGTLSPDKAYQYLANFPTISSVVVGMSRKEHATETVETIRRYLPSLWHSVRQ
jgi:hypothetical protein